MLSSPGNEQRENSSKIPITRDMVLAQLEEMGYARDILPPSVIESFLEELRDMEESTEDFSESRIDVSMSDSRRDVRNNQRTTSLGQSMESSTMSGTVEFQSTSVSDSTPIPLKNDSNHIIYKQIKPSTSKREMGAGLLDDSELLTENGDDTSSILPISCVSAADGISQSGSSSYLDHPSLGFESWTNEDPSTKIKTSHDHIQKEEDFDDEEIPSWSDIMERLTSLDLERVKERIQQQKCIATMSDGELEENTIDYYNDTGYTDDFQNEETEDSIEQKEDPDTTERDNPPRPNSGFIRTVQKIKKKRNDPVSRFHAHQRQWNRDPFLQRSKAKMAHPASGGLAAHSLLALEQSTTKRHNLAAKRSDYVIPTAKSRRDVIWQVRTRMNAM